MNTLWKGKLSSSAIVAAELPHISHFEVKNEYGLVTAIVLGSPRYALIDERACQGICSVHVPAVVAAAVAAGCHMVVWRVALADKILCATLSHNGFKEELGEFILVLRATN